MYNVANNHLLSYNNLYFKWTNRVKETLENEPNIAGYFHKMATNLANNIFKKTPNNLNEHSIPVYTDNSNEFVSDKVLIF